MYSPRGSWVGVDVHPCLLDGWVESRLEGSLTRALHPGPRGGAHQMSTERYGVLKTGEDARREPDGNNQTDSELGSVEENRAHCLRSLMLV